MLRLILSAVFITIAPSITWAACSTPAAEEGTIFYNSSVNAVQFCNGTDWVNTGLKAPSATGTSCTNPTADEGAMFYNTTVNTVQFCNGDGWMNMGTLDNSAATGTACTTPTAPEGAIIYNSDYSRVQFCNGDNWINATYYPQGLIDGLFIQKLVASDGTSSTRLGESVFIRDDLIITGGYNNSVNGSSSGVAYLFNAQTGSQLYRLSSTDIVAYDTFGRSVSVDGSLAIVGANGQDTKGSAAGAAYIFNTSTGAQLHKLMATDGASGDEFGYSVSIDSDTAAIGAWRNTDNGTDSGSAYIFNATAGTQTHKILPSDGAAEDAFGKSIAISGDHVVVGAPNDDDNGSESGSAYIFDATTGTQLYKLLPSDGAASDYFGNSVSISGNKAIIGAYGSGAEGAAYIFDVTTGAQLYKLTASDGLSSDAFGWSVNINSKYAIVGATHADPNGGQSGAAYIFDATTGSELHKLTAFDGASSDYFGSSVGISNGKAVVGAYGDDDTGSLSGSLYLFD